MANINGNEIYFGIVGDTGAKAVPVESVAITTTAPTVEPIYTEEVEE